MTLWRGACVQEELYSRVDYQQLQQCNRNPKKGMMLASYTLNPDSFSCQKYIKILKRIHFRECKIIIWQQLKFIFTTQ
jgi:hypothetical protein